MINYLAGIGIGLVIGLVGGFVLRAKRPAAIWQAPLLAVGGSVVASILASIFGEPSYGWKEPILQAVLAAVGVAVVAFLANRNEPAVAGADK